MMLRSPTTSPLTKPWMRAASVLLIWTVLLLYLPINRMATGGIAPKLPVDDLIPLWPIWAVPYLLVLPWWATAPVWGAFKMNDRLFRSMVIALIVAALSSYVVYVLYPTYVVRSEPLGQGWAMDLIRFLYGADEDYNALPSPHIYNTTLIAIFWWHWQRRLRWLWVATVLLIIPATLFTGQHYILDAVFGLIWAFAAFLIAMRVSRWRPAIA